MQEEVWTCRYQSIRKTLVIQCDNDMMSLLPWKSISDSCVAGKRGGADGRGGRQWELAEAFLMQKGENLVSCDKGYIQGVKGRLTWVVCQPPAFSTCFVTEPVPWPQPMSQGWLNHSMMKIQPRFLPPRNLGLGLKPALASERHVSSGLEPVFLAKSRNQCCKEVERRSSRH